LLKVESVNPTIVAFATTTQDVHSKTWPSPRLSFFEKTLFLLPSCQIAAYMKVSMSWPDMAFCFMLGASHHHKDDVHQHPSLETSLVHS
jgi:hypothetical protein